MMVNIKVLINPITAILNGKIAVNTGCVRLVIRIVNITRAMLLPTSKVLRKDFGSLYNSVIILPFFASLFLKTSILNLFADK